MATVPTVVWTKPVSALIASQRQDRSFRTILLTLSEHLQVDGQIRKRSLILS